MADYQYGSFKLYYNGTQSTVFSTNADGTITDADNDNQFESGDFGPNDVAGFKEPTIYYGTIDIGGTIYPVFQDTNYTSDLYVYALHDDELPSTIDTGTVNVGTPFALCFGPGTSIDTPDGPRNVETLKIGDLVVTETGDTVPVLWVGRQTLFPRLVGGKMQPVRIRAGSIGPNVPTQDLTVTADHGMIIDGLVINASALVNGTTIDFVPVSDLPERFTVYHIETEAHDVILANGAASETFIDAAGRKAFDNYAEYLELYGTERIIPEMRAPRITSARLLPEAIAEGLAASPCLNRLNVA